MLLITLCLAIFYWGLHYKLSLYHTQMTSQQAPVAKLWTGGQSLAGVKDAPLAILAPAPEIQVSWLAACVLIFALLLLLPASSFLWLRLDGPGAWKRQVMLPQSTLFFRPPPSRL